MLGESFNKANKLFFCKNKTRT